MQPLFVRQANTQIVLLLIALVILVAGAYVLFFKQASAPTSDTLDTPPNTPPSPTPASASPIIVNDQPAGGSVQVASVSSEQEGWVVVHDERNGEVGAIIAARRVNAGTTEHVVVDLLGAQTEAEKNYYVVLYNDNDDRKFDFKKDFPLKDASGATIAIKFMAKSDASEDMSSWKTYRNEKLKFEIKHPNDWEVFNGSPQNDYIDISLIDTSSRGKVYDGPYEWPGLKISTVPFNEEEIKGWGVHNANEFSLEKAKDGLIAIQFKLDNQNLYATCAIYDEPSIINNCNQILSTFKFTK